MFLFSACSTISAKVAACLRMSTGATQTNTATFVSGRIMGTAPAVRALALAAAHRSTEVLLDGRSPNAIADAAAPYDAPAQCALAQIPPVPKSQPRSIHWPSQQAIAPSYVGSSSTGTPPQASILAAANNRPATPSKPPPPAISAATAHPSLPDPRRSSCRPSL